MATQHNPSSPDTESGHKRVQREFYAPAMPPLALLDKFEQWTRRQVQRLRKH